MRIVEIRNVPYAGFEGGPEDRAEMQVGDRTISRNGILPEKGKGSFLTSRQARVGETWINVVEGTDSVTADRSFGGAGGEEAKASPVTPGSRCGLGVRFRAGASSLNPNPGLALRDLAGR